VVHLGMAPARQVVFEEGGDAMMAIHMRRSGRRHTLVAICERLSAVFGLAGARWRWPPQSCAMAALSAVGASSRWRSSGARSLEQQQPPDSGGCAIRPTAADGRACSLGPHPSAALDGDDPTNTDAGAATARPRRCFAFCQSTFGKRVRLCAALRWPGARSTNAERAINDAFAYQSAFVLSRIGCKAITETRGRVPCSVQFSWEVQ